MSRLQLGILLGLFSFSQFALAGNHQEEQGHYEALFTVTTPVIDGNGNDTCWNKASWAPIDQIWIGNAVEETDYSGRFKVLWTQNRLYLLIQIIDDSLRVQPSGLADVCSNIYNYDCSEIFIDENHSRDANYTGTYKAIAYHLDTTHVCYYIGGSTGWDRLDDHLNYKMTRVAAHTFEYEYEIKVFNDTYIHGGINTPVQLTTGKLLGWSVAYNDNDEGSTRQNMFGSKFIDGTDKNISYYNASAFGELNLIGGTATATSGIKLDNTRFNVSHSGNNLQIQYSGNSNHVEVSIQLFDVFGRQLQIMTAYKSENTLEKTLNISNLPKGIYILRISEKGLTQTKKIYL
jgi:hypothetical protein